MMFQVAESWMVFKSIYTRYGKHYNFTSTRILLQDKPKTDFWIRRILSSGEMRMMINRGKIMNFPECKLNTNAHCIPIFPPLAYGASKSTTLMPVTRISCSVLISTNSGASAWIAARLVGRWKGRQWWTFWINPGLLGYAYPPLG